MDLSEWYSSLNQPGWAPSAQTIGRVWTLLYPIILFVTAYVTIKYFNNKIPLSVALAVWINLGFNIAFTPIQITTKNNALISLIILLVLGTLIWAIAVLWPQNKWLAILYIPYLAWVAIATTLQLSLWWLNR